MTKTKTVKSGIENDFTNFGISPSDNAVKKQTKKKKKAIVDELATMTDGDDDDDDSYSDGDGDGDGDSDGDAVGDDFDDGQLD